jgi:hypothetical protein
MRAIQVSKVSSSTPAAMRVCLDCFASGDSAVAVLDIIGAVELDSAPATPTVAGFDEAGGSPAVGELPGEESIVPLLAQPPIISTTKSIEIVCLNIWVPPMNGSSLTNT